jgi:hypothetical protein
MSSLGNRSVQQSRILAGSSVTRNLLAVSLILSLSPLVPTPAKVKSSKKTVKRCKDLIPPAAVHCIP